jgi:nucleoside diphosphate kinase
MTSDFRSLAPAIVEQVRAVQARSSVVAHLAPFEAASDPSLLEGVLFLKPEATDLAGGVALDKVLELLAGYVERWELQVGGVSVLGAAYLKEHDIIARHYGVINNISRNGQGALAESAQAKLQELFGAELSAGAPVLGGHQFMERHPEYSSDALNQIVETAGSKKLAPGTYATKHSHGGETVVLLNAFHPQQLEHFTAPKRSIVVLAVRASASQPETWKALRNEMLGGTDPSQAAAGTLRRTFLERNTEFGLGEVNRGTNAVHFSAGPLEGMVETARYFSDYGAGKVLSYTATCFAGLLRAEGVTMEEVEWLATNPNLSLGGKQISAFDATEEVDPPVAAATLKQGVAAR